MTSHPTQIIIIGGTGDLSKRKLLPALFDLFTRGMLPANFHVVGIARCVFSDEEYREFVTEILIGHDREHLHPEDSLKDFCSHISFISGSSDDPDMYNKLNQTVSTYDDSQGEFSNRLYYLAVPPNHYEEIFVNLKESGAANEHDGCWTHVLVEKPFGKDLRTAQALDTKLSSLFREDQIFRIDHYLAKEAVQNILSFRFANTLMRAPWDKDSIESVRITMTETIDVGGRAGFYEGVGALRDVGQNHLLQLVALVAMRQPETFDVEAIRTERCRALCALVPVDASGLEKSVIRGQYEGYKADDSIPNDSETETYFELKAQLALPEWEGVPFYIRAGKALDKAEVSIVVTFKDVTTGMFETRSCETKGNEMKLVISPEETISITLNAKSPGLGFQLETRELSLTCGRGFEEIKNSYEKVLYDAIVGDQMLFTRTDEVLAAWSYITPILEAWKTLPLHTYQKGSAGPEETIIPNH